MSAQVLVQHGGRSMIVFQRGRKWLHAVAMDTPIAVVKIAADTRGLTEAQLKGKPYPVKRAARIYLKSQIAKTDKARATLRRIAKGKE